MMPARLRQRFMPRAKPEGMASLVLRENGIGVVHVPDPAARKPTLQVCHHQPVNDSRAVPSLLSELIHRFHLARVPFMGVLTAPEYTSFAAEAAKVPREALGSAMRWRVKDRLDYPASEAVVDVYDMAGPMARSGRIFVVAAHQDRIRAYAGHHHRLKLALLAIDVCELTLLNLMGRFPDDREGMGLVSLFPQGGMVLISRNRELCLARRIGVGLDALNGSLFTREDPAPPGVPGQAGALHQLALEIQRTLDYYESHFMGPPLSRIHLAPLMVPVPHLEDALAARLGLPVQALNLEGILHRGAECDSQALAWCLPAIGAALRTPDSGAVR